MPRVSRQQTEENRAKIEQASARLFRQQGFKAVSVNDLMGAAGLTHGGFYGHFESKDALLAVACDKTFAASQLRWKERYAAGDDPRAAFNALAANYLSRASRADAGTSCPASTLAADVAREDVGAPVRQAYTEGLKGLLAHLATLSDTDHASASARSVQAMQRLSMLVGAQMLARATDGDPLSDKLLASALAFLQQH